MIGSGRFDRATRQWLREGRIEPCREAARVVPGRGIATGEFPAGLDPDDNEALRAFLDETVPGAIAADRLARTALRSRACCR